MYETDSRKGLVRLWGGVGVGWLGGGLGCLVGGWWIMGWAGVLVMGWVSGRVVVTGHSDSNETEGCPFQNSKLDESLVANLTRWFSL